MKDIGKAEGGQEEPKYDDENKPMSGRELGVGGSVSSRDAYLLVYQRCRFSGVSSAEGAESPGPPELDKELHGYIDQLRASADERVKVYTASPCTP